MEAVGIYLRFSKQEQATPEAIESHIWQARRAVARIGGDPDKAEIYQDIMSGRRADRPDFDRLLRDIESGKIKTLVARQDRLSREVEMFVRLSKLVERTQIKLYDIIKGRFIDFTDPDDWSEYQRSGIAAERESRVNSRRNRDRKEFMRVQGKLQGRPPYGYIRNANGFAEPHLEQWELAQRMIQIFLESQSASGSVRQIQLLLGVTFTQQGFLHWLRNPMLRGHTPYGCKNPVGGSQPPTDIRWNTHPALVDAETWQQIQQILQRNRDRRGEKREMTHRVYALSGLVYCGRCGDRCHIKTIFSGKYPDKSYCYILCRNSLAAMGCGGGEIGHRPNLNTPYALAEEAVITALHDRGAEVIATGLQAGETAIESPEIMLLRQQIRQYELMAESDPDLATLLAKKRTQLTDLLSAGQSDQSHLRHTREKLAQYAADPEFFREATPIERQVLFFEFVDRVICDWVSVTVKLRI